MAIDNHRRQTHDTKMHSEARNRHHEHTDEPTVCATMTRVGTGSRERTNKCMCMATHCIRGNCYCMHACMHKTTNDPPRGVVCRVHARSRLLT